MDRARVLQTRMRSLLTSSSSPWDEIHDMSDAVERVLRANIPLAPVSDAPAKMCIENDDIGGSPSHLTSFQDDHEEVADPIVQLVGREEEVWARQERNSLMARYFPFEGHVYLTSRKGARMGNTARRYFFAATCEASHVATPSMCPCVATSDQGGAQSVVACRRLSRDEQETIRAREDVLDGRWIRQVLIVAHNIQAPDQLIWQRQQHVVHLPFKPFGAVVAEVCLGATPIVLEPFRPSAGTRSPSTRIVESNSSCSDVYTREALGEAKRRIILTEAEFLFQLYRQLHLLTEHLRLLWARGGGESEGENPFEVSQPPPYRSCSTSTSGTSSVDVRVPEEEPLKGQHVTLGNCQVIIPVYHFPVPIRDNGDTRLANVFPYTNTLLDLCVNPTTSLIYKSTLVVKMLCVLASITELDTQAKRYAWSRCWMALITYTRTVIEDSNDTYSGAKERLENEIQRYGLFHILLPVKDEESIGCLFRHPSALVYCQLGASRSPSVVIGHMMHRWKRLFQEQGVKEKRERQAQQSLPCARTDATASAGEESTSTSVHRGVFDLEDLLNAMRQLMATLKVTVHEARDLPVMDRTTGLADTYAVLKLAGTEYTTEIIPRTRHPIWNKDFRFDTPDLLVLQEDPLELRVYDHDIISRDDVVGMVLFDCNNIMYRENPSISGWFPIFDTNKGLHGDIRLTIRIKFHAAENPLSPSLAVRCVRRLHVMVHPELAAAEELNEGLPTMVVTNSAAVMSTPRSATLTGVVPSYTLPSVRRNTIEKKSTNRHKRRVTSDDAEGNQFYQNLSPFFASGLHTAGAPVPGGNSTFPGGPSARFSLIMEEGVDPILPTRMQHPTLSAEEEGILIFSVWRLDPSIYRVESVRSMVEELIVKADPEHSRFTNLRSYRSTNEARVVQLFKLSGKVRRQLARKVVEMHCNAVLGYVEDFDLEANGIIVRAYGTPCVLSAVKCVEEKCPSSLVWSGLSHPSPDTLLGGLMNPLSVTNATTHGAGALSHEAQLHSPVEASFSLVTVAGTGQEAISTNLTFTDCVSTETKPLVISASGVDSLGVGPASATIDETNYRPSHEAADGALHTTPSAPFLRSHVQGGSMVPEKVQSWSGVRVDSPIGEAVNRTTLHTGSGARTIIHVLTVKDLPSGCVQRIGGYICARSVKIVSKLKSKQMISQERDAWWMELREELRANARAFHCNTILGYEEETQYYEDVALLSLFGTAVMADLTMVSLRAGPAFLYQQARMRVETKKNCSIVHLYSGSHRKNLMGELGGQMHTKWCGVCHQRPVPDVIISSCVLPPDVSCDSPPRLIHATVAKPKGDVKGVDLAMVISQTLPFIEFALHKQLLFNLRLLQLNACFGTRVSVVVGRDAIVATLIGTGCRFAELPLPSPPRIQVVDQRIRRNATVMRLKDVVARRRRRRRGRAATSTSSSHSSRRSSGSRTCSSRSTSTSLSSSTSSSYQRSTSSSSRERSNVSTSSGHHSWVSSSADEEDVYRPTATVGVGKRPVTDYIVKIDDEEEAELMLGMTDDTSFEDSLLLTVPYIPGDTALEANPQYVSVMRRYSLKSTDGGQQPLTTRMLNKCSADAKRAFVVAACRAAMVLGDPERILIVSFRLGTVFEPNSGMMQMQLEGLLLMSSAHDRARRMLLESRAFSECVRNAPPAFQESLTANGGVQHLPHTTPLCASSGNTAGPADTTPELLTHPLPSDVLDSGCHTANGTVASATASVKNGCEDVGDPKIRLQRAEGVLPLHPSALGASLALSSCHAGATSSPIDHTQLHLFLACNAPFYLPFTIRREVPPLSTWLSSGASEEADVTTAYGRGRPSASTSGTDQRKSRSQVVQRQLQAMTSLASSTFRYLAAKTGVQADGKAADCMGRVDHSAASGIHISGTPLHRPAERVPRDLKTLIEENPRIVFTPNDFIPGQVIARYLGRISMPFIRESHESNTTEELSRFFQSADMNIQYVMCSLVRMMGGTALLQHRTVHHEVFDSDGSGCSFLFGTMTGEVVQTVSFSDVTLDGLEDDGDQADASHIPTTIEVVPCSPPSSMTHPSLDRW